jgi:NADP-dependent 3-hydroxy acid dehydrogenase YdfG
LQLEANSLQPSLFPMSFKLQLSITFRVMDDHSPLTNRIAVVTGASSGIGEAIAELLLRNGAFVANADIHEPSLAHTPDRYFFRRTDIGSGEEVQQFYDYVTSRIGPPSMLICNAGKGIHERLAEGDPDKWFRVINTNLMGNLRVLRSFLPDLLSTGKAEIVFISSVAARHAYEYGGIYSATKAAIDMVAETLRIELKDSARVTVVAPGVVDTGFFKNMESGGPTVESIGFGALSAREVAEAVQYALTRSRECLISNITLRPIRQSF